ncbi:MAG: hypothetical protein A3F46_11250 [Legionellales bacterium RIFCSPHIGHO2_12_FULL_42_9]|nr:MAG: hypothetical protein A3F46_11250 [Legionellales bacterium RIFCSPHIGHO2_12_FULL_42_9]
MGYAVTFDTLAYAKKLEACGVSVKQAEGQAEALANVLEMNFLSKKEAEINHDKLSNKIDLIDQKIDNLEKNMQQKIDGLEKNMQQKIDGLEKNMQQKMDGLEEKIQQKMDSLEEKIQQKMDNLKINIQQDIGHIKIDVIKWVIGIAFAQTALIFSVLKFLH